MEWGVSNLGRHMLNRILISIQSINLENLEIASYVYRKDGAETNQENIAAVALKEVKDRELSWGIP